MEDTAAAILEMISEEIEWHRTAQDRAQSDDVFRHHGSAGMALENLAGRIEEEFQIVGFPG
jgi:hypothetical protein